MHNSGAVSRLDTAPCFSKKNRRNNGANESNISSLLDYCRVQPIEDLVSTPKGGGGLNLIIAECSPLKT